MLLFFFSFFFFSLIFAYIWRRYIQLKWKCIVVIHIIVYTNINVLRRRCCRHNGMLEFLDTRRKQFDHTCVSVELLNWIFFFLLLWTTHLCSTYDIGTVLFKSYAMFGFYAFRVGYHTFCDIIYWTEIVITHIEIMNEAQKMTMFLTKFRKSKCLSR